MPNHTIDCASPDEEIRRVSGLGVSHAQIMRIATGKFDALIWKRDHLGSRARHGGLKGFLPSGHYHGLSISGTIPSLKATIGEKLATPDFIESFRRSEK